MSTLALMRWLESSPERYDAGMRVLSFGRVARLHRAVAEAATPEPGARVLEIGCGTGSVTRRLVERGATVLALDQSPEMLEQAQHRVGNPDAPDAAVEWLERTAAEVDALPPASFDSAVLCLCLSDMSDDEQRYVLRATTACVRPGGRVVVADEVHAPRGARRLLQRVMRGPQWLAAWLLTGSVSRPVAGLREKLEAAGVAIEGERRWLGGTLALITGVPTHRDP